LKGNAAPTVPAFPIAVTLFAIACFEAGAALTKGLFPAWALWAP